MTRAYDKGEVVKHAPDFKVIHGRPHDARMADDHLWGTPITPATWRECNQAFKQTWRELTWATAIAVILGLAVWGLRRWWTCGYC